MPPGRPIVLVALASLLLASPAITGCVASREKTEPSKVTNLRAEQVPQGALLSWDEFPRGIAVSYVLYRDGRKLAEMRADNRTFLDAEVRPAESHRYAVSAVNGAGREGARSADVRFVFRQSLALIQDAPVKRGFVNLTVASVEPGLTWRDLTVLIGPATIQRDEEAYRDRREAWTHTVPRDELVDQDDKLLLFAPGKAVRNATIEVRLPTGEVLVKELLRGRPTVNLTMRQERNATANLVSLLVVNVTLLDNHRDVTRARPDVIPRWDTLDVRVNGTAVPYRLDERMESWSNDIPSDEVIRRGSRINIRSLHVGPTATVIVSDIEAGEESFRVRLR